MNLTTLKVTGTEVLGGGRRGESITTEVTVIVEVNTMSMISMIRVNRTQLLFIFSKTYVDDHCWCQAQPMSKDNNNCRLILFSYYSNWISSIYNVGQCQCNIVQWVELSDISTTWLSCTIMYKLQLNCVIALTRKWQMCLLETHTHFGSGSRGSRRLGFHWMMSTMYGSSFCSNLQVTMFS